MNYINKMQRDVLIGEPIQPKEDKTPMEKLADWMRTSSLSVNGTALHHKIVELLSEEKSFIREKEREAAEKGFNKAISNSPYDRGRNVYKEKEQFLNTNYPKI